MEMITAIALLCQINGFGTGTEYGGSLNDATNIVVELVKTKQASCQKELAKCILKKDKLYPEFRQSTVLKCISER